MICKLTDYTAIQVFMSAPTSLATRKLPTEIPRGSRNRIMQPNEIVSTHGANTNQLINSLRIFWPDYCVSLPLHHARYLWKLSCQGVPDNPRNSGLN